MIKSFKNVLTALVMVMITISTGWAIDETITFKPTVISNNTVEVEVTECNQNNLITIGFALKYSDGLKFKEAHFKNSRVEYFDFNMAKKFNNENIIIYGGIWQFSPEPNLPLSAGTGLVTTLIFEIIDPTIEINFEAVKTVDPVHQAIFVCRVDEVGQSKIYPKIDIKPTSYITSTDDIIENTLPEQFELFQNYPNPFNPTTTISFALPVTSQVNLSIFNINGQLVKPLISGQLSAGTHKINWNINSMSSGIYFYRITAENFSATKKMVVLK